MGLIGLATWNGDTNTAVESKVAEAYKSGECTTRKMTDEEWAKYGRPVKVKRRKTIQSIGFEW